MADERSKTDNRIQDEAIDAFWDAGLFKGSCKRIHVDMNTWDFYLVIGREPSGKSEAREEWTLEAAVKDWLDGLSNRCLIGFRDQSENKCLGWFVYPSELAVYRAGNRQFYIIRPL